MGVIGWVLVALVAAVIANIVRITNKGWAFALARWMCRFADWLGATDGEYGAEVLAMKEEDDRGLLFAFGACVASLRRPNRPSRFGSILAVQLWMGLVFAAGMIGATPQVRFWLAATFSIVQILFTLLVVFPYALEEFREYLQSRKEDG